MREREGSGNKEMRREVKRWEKENVVIVIFNVNRNDIIVICVYHAWIIVHNCYCYLNQC